ncbi:uncharacterized protein KIAA1671 homolog [Thomomys bottae]
MGQRSLTALDKAQAAMVQMGPGRYPEPWGVGSGGGEQPITRFPRILPGLPRPEAATAHFRSDSSGTETPTSLVHVRCSRAHGSPAVAMVEVGSLFTAVPGLADLAKDDALKRTYFYQARDPTVPTSACVVRSSARCFPLPQLAPKPFSKEQGLHRGDPGLPRSGPAVIPWAASRGLDGRMPSLAGQDTGDGEGAQSPPHKASSLRHAVAIFETHITGPPVGTATGERCPATSTGSPRDPPFRSRPQVAAKPALPTRKPPGTLPWPASQPQEARSAAALQKDQEAGQARPLPKASSVEDPAGLAPGPRLRLKRRPVSAIFTEFLPPPELGMGELGLGRKPAPAPPEKTWVRKPRPLSVDLTARFESKEGLLRKVAMEGAGAEPRGEEGASPEPAADCAIQAPSSRLHLDADFQEMATKIQDRKEKTLWKRAEAGALRTPGGSARAILGGDQSPEEEKDWRDPEPQKVPQSPPWAGRGLGPTDAKSGRADGEAALGAVWISTSSVKKRLSLFGEEAPAVGSEGTVATPETPPAALELKKTGVSVQARIKGWAAEGTEEKVEVRKKALQARPKSADWTKVFSSSASSSEIAYEKCAVLGGELPGERREKQQHGCSLHSVPSPQSPWKHGSPQKASGQTEHQASSRQDPDSLGQVPRASPEGEGSFQTVWATMFEHHVERHSVAEQGSHLSGSGPRSGADACVSGPRARPSRGPWPGKDLPVGQAVPSDCVSGQCPAQAPEKPAMRDNCSQTTLPKHLTQLPWGQRVEPRLDIVHAVGDRAHSEAVPTVVGNKAMTLHSARSRRLLQGRWLTQEVISADLEGKPEAPVGAVHRASLIWEARGQENSGPKLGSPEPGDTPENSCSASRWTGRGTTHWHSAAVTGSQEPCAPRDASTKVVQAVPWETQRQGPDRVGHKPAGSISTADRAPAQGSPPGPLSRVKDKACDLHARGHPEAKEPLPAAREGDPQMARGAEPGVRLRRPLPGDHRLDRRRRRTLPHHTKFDVSHFVPPENAYKGEQKRTGPLSPPASAFQRPQETRGVTAGAMQAPGSPGEPQATFFAVTCQIPDIQKVKSMVKLGLENLLEHSRKTALAPSPCALPSGLVSPKQEEPSGPSGTKPWAGGSGGDHIVTASRSPKATEHSCPVGDRVRDRPSDRPLSVGALWIPPSSQDDSASQNTKKNGWSQVTPNTPNAPQVPPAPKASGQLERRKTEVISETFPGKMKDTYRSSVLDLDALMEEYKAKFTGAVGQAQAVPSSPTTEAGTSPRERPGRPSAVAPEAQGPWKQASVAETMDSPTSGLSKLQMGDSGTPTTPKTGSPMWGPPQSAQAPMGSSSWKRVWAITEEGHGAVGMKTQSQPAGTRPCGQEDPGSRVPLSPKSPPAEPKKSTPRTPTKWSQGDSVTPRDNPFCGHRRPLDVKRACSEKGPPSRIREGLEAMQAMHRQQEQLRGRPGYPSERVQAKGAACRAEPQTAHSQQVPPWDVNHSGVPRGSEKPICTLSPEAGGPRRTQSLCKDQRAGPCMDQLKQCFSRRSPEAKDTDTLVQDGDGAWVEPRSSGDSVAPESPSPDGTAPAGRRQPSSRRRFSSPSSPSSPTSPPGPTMEEHGRPASQRSTSTDRSGSEMETTDSPGVPLTPDAHPVDHFPFIHQTSVLDSSALKTRAQLSKRNRRRAPTLSHNLRSRSGPGEEEEEAQSMWMFKDSTEEKSPRKEESDEEENPSRVERTPTGHPHRAPAFPGMDPAVLKARLHKRPEMDSPGEMPNWTPKTPKSPFQPRVLGGRVLPSSVDKDERSEEPSPQWLRELKSKKRQSLCENQA